MPLPPIAPLGSLSGTSGTQGAQALGKEFGVGSLDGAPAADGQSSFGGMLGNALKSLQSTQEAAATASQQLAAGTATDPSAVVMSVERARLSMQLASQLRTKGVEAIQDVMRTQV